MAHLDDSPLWGDIYQLEQTDPVIGGAPNPATGAGMDNIPHLQLAQRTSWLKAAVDTLVSKVVIATTSVAGLVQLSTSTNSTSTTTAATPSAVKAANDNANSRALKTTTVSASGLALGGGDLGANRVIAVPVATQAEALAGALNTVAMTPLRAAEMLAAAGIGTGSVPALANLDTVAKSGLYHIAPGAVGSPDPAYDGRLIHIQRGGEASQIATMGSTYIAFRDKDTSGEDWTDWQKLLIGDYAHTYASNSDAPDSWLVAANFKGVTGVKLGAWSGTCLRVGRLAHVVIDMTFNNFSIVAADDEAITAILNLNAIAQASGWFNTLSHSARGQCAARLADVWDAPNMALDCAVDAGSGTIQIATYDTKEITAQSSNATQMTARIVFTALVGS